VQWLAIGLVGIVFVIVLESPLPSSSDESEPLMLSRMQKAQASTRRKIYLSVHASDFVIFVRVGIIGELRRVSRHARFKCRQLESSEGATLDTHGGPLRG